MPRVREHIESCERSGTSGQEKTISEFRACEPGGPEKTSVSPRRVLAITLVALLLFRLGAAFAHIGVSDLFVRLQDSRLLWFELALGALAIVPIGWAGSQVLAVSHRMVWVIACVVAVVAYIGHYHLLSGHDLSRDEQMAVFDAQVYGSGKLAQPLSSQWQTYASALNLVFMLPVKQPVAWISAYLPGNALLRAGFALIGDQALTGPVLALVSLVLVWRCARLLWPDELEPQAIAVWVSALSGQVVMTSMTAYAMPAHLCFNLAWLWLFFWNRRSADCVAVFIGFAATGLHQPLPHPLFVIPFLLLLVSRREWPRVALFSTGYAAIGLFWLMWPLSTHALVAGPLSMTVGHGTNFFGRLIEQLALNIEPLQLMAANLLRFCTWQALPMIPLLVLGFSVARRDTTAAALAGGIVLSVAVLALIIAYQGHGFGYRYLHGLIGNAALLAGYGWRALAAHQDRLRPVLRRGLVLSAVALLPAEAAMAHALYAPFANVRQRIVSSGADYVAIVPTDAPYVTDLVINRPDLANRPILLEASKIADPQRMARMLCHLGVRVIVPEVSTYHGIVAYFGMGRKPSAKPIDHAPLTSAFAAAGCDVSEKL